MSHAQVASTAFFVFSVLLFFLFLFFCKRQKETILPQRFFLLSWSVYVSGTLLILVLSFLKEGIVLAVILICEILILCIGIGSVCLMYMLSKGLKSASEISVTNRKPDDEKKEA